MKEKIKNPKSSNKNESADKKDVLKIDDIVGSIPLYCDKCGSLHDKDSIEIIDKNENLTIIYMMCENCLSKNIMYVIKPLNVINKTVINVDLESSEIKKFAGSKSINTDDILNIYSTIKSKKISKAKDFIDELLNRD
jgi:copper chaperone CopZ